MTLKQFCFSFEGRINRRMYWVYLPISVILTVTTGLITVAAEANGADWVLVFVIPSFLVKVIIDFAVTVKRLHDTNRRGSYALLAVIPVIGAIYLLIACGLVSGTDGENDYGPPSPDKIT